MVVGVGDGVVFEFVSFTPGVDVDPGEGGDGVVLVEGLTGVIGVVVVDPGVELVAVGVGETLLGEGVGTGAGLVAVLPQGVFD